MKDTSFKLNDQQLDTLDALTRWFRHETQDKQVFRLFGYAGTGKTTMARIFADRIKARVVYGAFTGKAALRMEQAGCTDAATLHSLLYFIDEDERGNVRWVRRTSGPISEADLVIVDEASMVNEEMARDLMSFGKPILVLGDPAQLPPIDGEGFFMRMAPDAMLTTIERTAAGNPLLALATLAREGKPIPYGTYGDSAVIGYGSLGSLDLNDFDQVIVGTNRLRVELNIKIREMLGRRSPYPEVGDRLIGTRNDWGLNLRNGEHFMVTALEGVDKYDDTLMFEVQSLDRLRSAPMSVKVPPECFTKPSVDFRDWDEVQFMTYGYAITGHKSQGSEWDRVLVVDESQLFQDDARRWLYTVLTRAKTQVTLVR